MERVGDAERDAGPGLETPVSSVGQGGTLMTSEDCTLSNPREARMRSVVGTVLCGLCLGCSTPTEPALVGMWGGQEASMVLTLDGGSVSHVCGKATVDPGWTLTKTGVFGAVGHHQSSAGPVPVGGRPEYPAWFDGRLQGDPPTLTIRVLVEGDSSSIGPFALIRNGPEVPDRCK